MKYIELSKNGKYKGLYYCLVDDCNFDELNKYNWYVNIHKHTNYASAKIKNKTILMHRMIMNCNDTHVIDHIDNNGLNNTLVNLRICTQSDNLKKCISTGKSKYKGVSFLTTKNKSYIRADIKICSKQKFLGYFKTEIDAAKAYDDAAILHHGEFANLNFPEL